MQPRLRLALISLLVLASRVSAQLPTFTPDLTLDPTGTDAEFGRLCGVAVAPDGTIFVGDWGFGRIHVFDDDGTHRTSFGQVGEAPGDLPANVFRLGIDREGTLAVGGSRPFVAWLTPDGKPLRTVQRGDGSHMIRDLEFLEGGRIVVTYATLFGLDSKADPVMVHVLAPDGTREHDFASATFWNDSLNPVLADAIVRGRATASRDGKSLLFVQSQPFVLRRYAPDGSVLAESTEGAGPFIHDLVPPKVEGVRVIAPVTADADKPYELADGRLLVFTWRVHPEDLDLPATQPDKRIERRLYVFDSELHALGWVEAPGWPFAVDPVGRVWMLPRETETPVLVRYRVGEE